MALTDKQKWVVEEYLVDLSATQAAIRAGHSAKTTDQPDEEIGRQAGHGAVRISADHTRLRLLERGRRHHEGQRDVGPALP